MKKTGLAILVLFFLVGCRSQALEVDVHFEHLTGLAPGDRVVFESNEAGHVDAIQFNKDGSYQVRLNIDRGFTHAATEQTRFRVVDDAARAGHKAVEMVLHGREGQPLADGARVEGDEALPSLEDQLNRGLEEGFALLKEQIERFSEDLQDLPQSDTFKQMKKSLSDLADEIVRAEKQARQKIKEQWLPRIERELQELKRRLEAEGREDEAELLQRELERIQNI